MKSGFGVGHSHTLRYVVRENNTVPHLLPALPEFQRGHPVLATGFMVGLLEAPCMAALFPFCESDESYVGTRVDMEHATATPPDTLLTLEATCTHAKGTYFEFQVAALDDEDSIAAQGTVGCRIVRTQRFRSNVEAKAERIQLSIPRQFALGPTPAAARVGLRS